MKQTESNAPKRAKRAEYSKPELKEYGTVSAITAGLPTNANKADNTKTTNKTSLIT